MSDNRREICSKCGYCHDIWHIHNNQERTSSTDHNSACWQRDHLLFTKQRHLVHIPSGEKFWWATIEKLRETQIVIGIPPMLETNIFDLFQEGLIGWKNLKLLLEMGREAYEDKYEPEIQKAANAYAAADTNKEAWIAEQQIDYWTERNQYDKVLQDWLKKVNLNFSVNLNIEREETR